MPNKIKEIQRRVEDAIEQNTQQHAAKILLRNEQQKRQYITDMTQIVHPHHVQRYGEPAIRYWLETLYVGLGTDLGNLHYLKKPTADTLNALLDADLLKLPALHDTPEP